MNYKSAALLLTQIVLIFIFGRLASKLGLLFMDELGAAIAPFFRGGPSSSSGGIPGLPGPSGSGLGGVIVLQQAEPSPTAAPVHAVNQGEIWDELQSGVPPEPLISKDQRLEELRAEVHRLVDVGLLERLPKPAKFTLLITTQCELEIQLETALRSEGYSDESILSARADWRRAAYAKDTSNTPISGATLVRTMSKHPDVKDTPYWKRIQKGIQYGAIRLSKRTR